ncbi:hypothetical protein BRETT_001298 [Brettanomyces bruxellensis]|uniref:G protein-coupled receptor GPR1 n=1 Tax=Dekkera bruxellensis TaxID=5007 RepID=A0A871R4W0_DEKBR|nr:uncharacterized protein BRETT_001298 [Brettanomyces bruxellensis]QOU21573.1 hypothetical protein BRETT_001298 [Brettanomyces bruxellensis]
MLIIFDFIKALALLLYPAVAEATKESIMESIPFRNVLGWFTCFSIEGGDFIILCFAVHIALLVFFPNQKFKFYNHNRLTTSNPQEGGLYPFRIYLYMISIVFPSLISSVGYVSTQGYTSEVNWSFLTTVRPVWYFTWIFRYCIVIIILSMYVGTYVHVTHQYKVVSSKMNLEGGQKHTMLSTLLRDSVWYKLGKFVMMLVFPDVQISAKLHGRALNSKTDMANIRKLHARNDISFNEDPFSNSQGTSSTNNTYSGQEVERQEKEEREEMEEMGGRKERKKRQGRKKNAGRKEIDEGDGRKENQENQEGEENNEREENGQPEFPQLDHQSTNSDEATEVESTESEKVRRLQRDMGLDIQRMLHREAMDRFEVRRAQIMKQMKVIFVYPVSYLLLWMFPFIHQCYVLKHNGEVTSNTYVWYAMAAFFQAFNCTIDTLVFLYRERPWTLTVARVDPGMRFSYSLWRHWLSFLPGYHLDGQTRPGSAVSGCSGGSGSSRGSLPGHLSGVENSASGVAMADLRTRDLEKGLSGIEEEQEGIGRANGEEKEIIKGTEKGTEKGSTKGTKKGTEKGTEKGTKNETEKDINIWPENDPENTQTNWLPRVDLDDEDLSDFVRLDPLMGNAARTRRSADSTVDPNDSYVSLRDFLNSMAGPDELQGGQLPEPRRRSKISEGSLPDRSRRENRDRRSSKFSWRTFPFRGSLGGPVKKSTSTTATAP